MDTGYYAHKDVTSALKKDEDKSFNSMDDYYRSVKMMIENVHWDIKCLWSDTKTGVNKIYLVIFVFCLTVVGQNILITKLLLDLIEELKK